MRRTGDASGFTLSDLVIPLAVLMLIGAVAGHYYKRHIMEKRESQIERVAREMFGDDGEQVLEEMRSGAAGFAVSEAVKRKAVVAKADPAPEREKPAQQRLERGKPSRPPAKAAAKKKPRSVASVTENGLAPIEERRGESVVDRTRRIYAAHDKRCQEMMDGMYR
jgi:hypothetical protein